MAQKHTEQTDPLNALWERQRVSAVPYGAPQKWGHFANSVLQGLQNFPILIGLTDGGALTGSLVGYSPHWLTITVKGEAMLVNKGQIVTIRLAAPPNGGV